MSDIALILVVCASCPQEEAAGGEGNRQGEAVKFAAVSRLQAIEGQRWSQWG